MRVLFINFEYPPIGGGGANATWHILEKFKKTPELKLDLVTSGISSRDRIISLSESIKIHRLSINKKNLHFWTLGEIITSTIRTFFYTRHLAAQNQYDLIHAFFTVPGGLVALPFSFKIPLIISLRGTDVPYFNERFRWLYPFLKPLISFIWKKSAIVVSNSEGLKELALKTYPGLDIKVIPNGVHPVIDDISKKKISRVPPYHLLTVARLIKRKNLHLLIDALDKLKGDGILFHQDIIGDGVEKTSLQGLINSRNLREEVTLRGYLSPEDIASYYRDADLFILPSTHEGMSNTVLEAMSAGTPVIVTKTGGADELIGDNGIVLREITSEAIHEAVKNILSSYDDMKRMSANSYELSKKFTWDTTAGKYLECYRKLA